MIDERELLQRYAGLGHGTLRIWIERGWVMPERKAGTYRFREIDAARVGLIREFTTELALGEDAVGVVLGLVDQVHGLRHQLRALAEAVSREPADVRRRIADAMAPQKKA